MIMSNHLHSCRVLINLKEGVVILDSLNMEAFLLGVFLSYKDSFEFGLVIPLLPHSIPPNESKSKKILYID